jgi:hypothetical protein
VGTVEERKISRGTVIFAVLTRKKSDEIKNLLGDTGLEMEIQ